jgi:MFS family permease
MYRSIALSVYLPSFFMAICQGSVLLMIPLFALEVGANPATAALIFAMRGLGNMVMDVPAGYLTARLGDKTTMLMGVAVMAVVGFLASQCSSSWQLACAAFCFGGAMGTWTLARLSHISEAIHVTQRGKAIAGMAGLQRFGNLIGPVCSGIVADQFGFSYVFVGIGLIATFSFVFVVINVKRNQKGHTDESPGIFALIPHILAGHWKVFASAGVAILLLTVLRAGRQLLIPLWGESIGLDATDIGLVVGMAASIDLLMFIPVGYILDNWGRKYSAISCLGILAVGLLLIPLSYDFITLAMASMVAGFGNGLGSGINMTLGADFSPQHERGEFLGVWRLVGDVGSFAGPIIVGYIANTFVLATAFSVSAGLGIVGVLIMAFFVRETLVKPEP